MFKLRIPKFNIWAMLIILFPICNTLASNIAAFSILKNYDEIISLIFIAIIAVLFIGNKLTQYDTYICIMLIFITVLGLASNLFSNVISEWFPIVVDVLWLWKPFSVYIVFKYVSFKKEQRETILTELTDISKFIVLFTTATSLIGQFVNIKVVSESERVFRIFKQYNYFWRNGIQTGWLIIGALIVLSVTIDNKSFFKYFLISCVPLILTGSSMIYCWIALTLLLRFIFAGKYKFKFWHLLVLAPLMIAINYKDFKDYMISDSVRKIFFQKGMMLANDYFPFGAGFATFGTEMALRYYSKLYISWGWENDWSLGRGSGFLNDTFYASMLGQFGWIGFLLYVICLIFIFIQANNKLLSREERAISMSTIITIAITMIGSATAKSMMGVFVFALLGVLCGKPQKQYSGIKLKG